eukprot:gene943-4196_t
MQHVTFLQCDLEDGFLKMLADALCTSQMKLKHIIIFDCAIHEQYDLDYFSKKLVSCPNAQLDTLEISSTPEMQVSSSLVTATIFINLICTTKRLIIKGRCFDNVSFAEDAMLVKTNLPNTFAHPLSSLQIHDSNIFIPLSTQQRPLQYSHGNFCKILGSLAPNLRDLSLNQTLLPPAIQRDILLCLRSLQLLETLSLEHCELTSDSMSVLVTRLVPKLRFLHNLKFNTRAVLTHNWLALAQTLRKKYCKLRQIIFSSPSFEISSEAIQALSRAVMFCPRLHTLELSHTLFSNELVERFYSALQRLLSNPCIRYGRQAVARVLRKRILTAWDARFIAELLRICSTWQLNDPITRPFLEVLRGSEEWIILVALGAGQYIQRQEAAYVLDELYPPAWVWDKIEQALKQRQNGVSSLDRDVVNLSCCVDEDNEEEEDDDDDYDDSEEDNDDHYDEDEDENSNRGSQNPEISEAEADSIPRSSLQPSGSSELGLVSQVNDPFQLPNQIPLSNDLMIENDKSPFSSYPSRLQTICCITLRSYLLSQGLNLLDTLPTLPFAKLPHGVMTDFLFGISINFEDE